MFNLLLTINLLLGINQLDSIAALPDSLPDLKIKAYESFISSGASEVEIATARLGLGDQFQTLRFQDRALEQYDQALEIFQSLRDSLGIYETLNKMSQAYSTVQEFDNALTYAREAVLYNSDINQLKVTNHRIGYIYFNLNRTDSAEKYLQLAVDQYNETNSVPVASLLMLAGLHINMGNYETALRDMLRLEQLGISSGSLTSQYYTYNFISALYKKLGKDAQSRIYRAKRDSLKVTLDQVSSPLDFLETNVIADTLSKDFVNAIENQRLYIDQLKEIYKNDLSTQLANFQKVYELREKEGKINLLEKENELYELRQKENRAFVIILFLSVLTLSLTVFIGYRILISRNKTNQELKSLNARISDQSADLKEKNELLERTIKELKGTQSQLIQSEKMASIGSFVSGVAHELNNPINILNGGLQVIERNLKEMNFEQGKDLDLMDDINVMLKESSFSITKINRIIQALIIATYTDQTPMEVDFTEIVDNVKISLREETVKGNVKFIQEVESVRYKCFPNRIHHAIKSVLENAFYYAKKSSTNEQFVRLEVKEKAKELIVKIENSGPAIPEEDLLKIFDPFYTTKDDGESPGLGLYFAFSAVQEHRGSISASNKSGNVDFTMRLPK